MADSASIGDTIAGNKETKHQKQFGFSHKKCSAKGPFLVLELGSNNNLLAWVN